MDIARMDIPSLDTAGWALPDGQCRMDTAGWTLPGWTLRDGHCQDGRCKMDTTRMGTAGWTLLDGHCWMGTAGWTLQDGHSRMGTARWTLQDGHCWMGTARIPLHRCQCWCRGGRSGRRLQEHRAAPGTPGRISGRCADAALPSPLFALCCLSWCVNKGGFVIKQRWLRQPGAWRAFPQPCQRRWGRGRAIVSVPWVSSLPYCWVENGSAP